MDLLDSLKKLLKRDSREKDADAAGRELDNLDNAATRVAREEIIAADNALIAGNTAEYTKALHQIIDKVEALNLHEDDYIAVVEQTRGLIERHADRVRRSQEGGDRQL